MDGRRIACCDDTSLTASVATVCEADAMSAKEQTELERQLSKGKPTPKPTAWDAFELARRSYNAGERIEMGAIADRLGINRATLYRWVGSRERLLVEVIWYQTERAMRETWEASSVRGAERIVELLTS